MQDELELYDSTSQQFRDRVPKWLVGTLLKQNIQKHDRLKQSIPDVYEYILNNKTHKVDLRQLDDLIKYKTAWDVAQELYNKWLRPLNQKNLPMNVSEMRTDIVKPLNNHLRQIDLIKERYRLLNLKAQDQRSIEEFVSGKYVLWFDSTHHYQGKLEVIEIIDKKDKKMVRFKNIDTKQTMNIPEDMLDPQKYIPV